MRARLCFAFGHDCHKLFCCCVVTRMCFYTERNAHVFSPFDCFCFCFAGVCFFGFLSWCSLNQSILPIVVCCFNSVTMVFDYDSVCYCLIYLRLFYSFRRKPEVANRERDFGLDSVCF